MGKTSDPRKGVVGSVRAVVDGLLQTLRSRGELFGVELRIERARLAVSLTVALSAALGAFMTFLCANLLLLFLFWEQRVAVCIGLAVFYAMVTVGLVFVLRYRVRHAPQPFAATLGELEKDRALFTKP